MARWDNVMKLGGFSVYATGACQTKVSSKGDIMFGKHKWVHHDGLKFAGTEVSVYVPVGGPSGANKSAIVLLNDKTIIEWARSDQ